MSGRPRSSGMVQVSGSVPGIKESGSFSVSGSFLVGEQIDVDAPVPFQLAPRLYKLSVADDTRQAAAALVALADLPLHLTFREMATQHPRQCWLSDDSTDWHWELVVERNGAGIAATLTCSSSSHRTDDAHTWRSRGGWNPFGSNRLRMDESDQLNISLIVEAP